jgi:hypothetical protein
MDGDRAELMRRVAAGEYVVDPHAVAGAMLSRAPVRELLLGSDAVLEPGEPNGLARGADERDAGAGPDAA